MNSLNKIKYILKLSRTTPLFGWIIIIQLISGVFSIAGIPLLIPIVEYIRKDTTEGANQINFAFIDKVFNFFGIGTSFYALVICASLLIVFGQVLLVLSEIIAVNVQQKISGGFRKRLFDSYLGAEWLWLTGDKSGDMNNAVIREAQEAGLASLNSLRLFIHSVQVLVYLFIAIKLSFSITMLSIVVYGVLLVFSAKNSDRLHDIAEKHNETFKSLSSSTANLLQNKKLFKSSLLYKSLMDKVNYFIKEIIQLSILKTVRLEMQKFWMFVFTYCFLISIIIFRNMLNIGFSELVVLILVFQRLSPQFSSLARSYLSLSTCIPIHKSITKRLTEFEMNEEAHGGEIFECDEAIKLDSVHFSYPDGKKVINNLSLEIMPHQTVAFVGSSGAGKSTILDLILGLLKPGSGAIYYGSINHNQLNKKDFRKKIAYVSQETTLLDGSLLENLTVGDLKVDNEMIRDVCKQVQIDELVSRLPDGIHTEIGENGIKLSGGQRQRVAFARALLMNPEVIILDEATSELDTETEMLIHKAIEDLHQKMTIIIVAHRLSTVKFADNIFVIENGTICETGKYDELLKKKGRLHYLDSLQSGARAIPI